jgi:hypothetical protein
MIYKQKIYYINIYNLNLFRFITVLNKLIKYIYKFNYFYYKYNINILYKYYIKIYIYNIEHIIYKNTYKLFKFLTKFIKIFKLTNIIYIL